MNPPRRLTLRETAAALGTNVGTVFQLRAKDSRTSAPTFPPMTNGTFDEAAVLAWRADRDAKAAPAANPTPLEK